MKQDILTILEIASKKNLYYEDFERYAYSSYYEGWQDAVEFIQSEITELLKEDNNGK